MLYNIYCDESCHLEHDGINVMVLGAIWCPQPKLKEINHRIQEIKVRNGIKKEAELKWTKLSPSQQNAYIDLINYFFDDDDLHFRAVVIPDKSKLDHKRFKQTHDDWYYKMYFEMLKHILAPRDRYEIYIDIKDTHSFRKSQKLKEVCCNSMYDFSSSIIERLQPIRSDEVQIMQLVDIQALVVHVCIGQKPALRRRDHDQLPGIRFPQVSIGITAAFILFQCHCIKQIFHVHT